MLKNLLKEKTREEVLKQVLDEIADPTHDFPLTDVHPGSVWRTLVEGDVAALVDLYKMVPQIAQAGFLELAKGGWLDLRAENFYDLERKNAVFARYTVTLTSEVGFGPYNIDAGQFWVLAQPNLRYYNVAGGTLQPASTLDLEFIAEEAGARYNVVEGAITKILTPLPGVTAINKEDSLVTAGADEESDSQLRRRTVLRWPELGTGGPPDVYKKWALEAVDSITRVRVVDDHPRGQGTVNVIVAGTGGTGSSDVAKVDEYIQDRRPVTADVLVMAAEVQTVVVEGQVRVLSGNIEAAKDSIAENFLDLQQKMDIGSIVYKAEIVEQIMRAVGVINVVLDSPTTDVLLSDDQIVNFVVNKLTYVEQS